MSDRRLSTLLISLSKALEVSRWDWRGSRGRASEVAGISELEEGNVSKEIQMDGLRIRQTPPGIETSGGRNSSRE